MADPTNVTPHFPLGQLELRQIFVQQGEILNNVLRLPGWGGISQPLDQVVCAFGLPSGVQDGFDHVLKLVAASQIN